ncbi:MAG: hypothetical protein OXU67_09305 [Chloroflexota bacterium]|nr:hypothetical protein [Chloroflexota bacterium]
MRELRQAIEGHPSGDGPSAAREVAREAVKLDTFGGTVHVEWDPDAAATLLGHLASFAEYLKVSGRFDALVADCPLHYTCPNAPSKRNILGTLMLSILAGQWHYAHITALRGDGVNPSLLDMTKMASEDSVRRALERIGAEDGAFWLHGHLDDTVRPRSARTGPQGVRRLRRARQEAGLCTSCGRRPPSDNASVCEPCRAERRELDRRRYVARRATGRCVRCSEPTPTRLSRCGRCFTLEKQRVSPQR